LWQLDFSIGVENTKIKKNIMLILDITKHDLLITIMAVSIFLIALIVFTSIKRKYLIKNNFLDEIINNSKKEEERLFKKLKKMVFSDKDTAERLIGMEKGRTPNASRIKLILSAIERLERDRR
jgi:hypothetical protein